MSIKIPEGGVTMDEMFNSVIARIKAFLEKIIAMLKSGEWPAEPIK